MKSTRKDVKILMGAAALLLAGSACADVSVYGLIDVGYGVNRLTQGENPKAQFYSGGDNGNSAGNSTTRLGLKGSFDLSSDLKLNFRFESNGITSNGRVNEPLLGRAAWVGASGSFGEFRLGRQDSLAFVVQNKFDLNWASNSTSALVYTMVAPYFPGRQSAVLEYISPKFGAVTLYGSFKPSDGSPGAKATSSVGATYDDGPLSVGVVLETARSSTSKRFASIAGSYDFKVVKLMGSYADGGDPEQGGSGKGVGLGVSAPVAGMTVGAIYGQNTDTRDRATELFVQKELYKNLYGYINVARMSLRAGNLFAPVAGTYNNYGVGVILFF